MASDLEFVQYVCDQLEAAGPVRWRKMFGEYALYDATKVVALICDNQLYLKPTPGGRAWIGTPTEAPPYPGARPHYLIADELEQRDWLATLWRITARELPEPKPKTPRRRPARSGG